MLYCPGRPLIWCRYLAFLIAIPALFGFAVPCRAQTDATLRSQQHLIEDAGQRRTFDIALDELQATNAARRGRRIAHPGVATGEAARKLAESTARTTGEEVELVLYEAGRPHSEYTRRTLTKTISVKLAPGADAKAVASASGLVYRGPAPAGDYVLFEATRTGGALAAAEALRKRAEVLTAEPQLARQQKKRFLPNDTLFSQQWHLRNTGQGGGLSGIDVNITPAWDLTAGADFVRGKGIRIGIVDDGLQVSHPDLSPNVDTLNDHDWNDATPDDPSPDVTADFHGSSCAGVAAGRGNNSLGISGAAPEATLVGLRLIGAAATDAQEAEAMAYKSDIIQIKSNSWGPNDDGKTLEGPGTLATAALAQATQTGRGGLGTVFVWAGGNGGDVGDNSNYDGYANSIYTIAVGAVGNDGARAYYSEPGANLVVTAPSNGGPLSIVTTDLVGDNGYNATGVTGELSDRNYTSQFGGTSSAAPLAAGCVALILQKNPALGWRDVQEILIRSAKKVDATHADWITNGAGFHFNHDFGAGLLDTLAAVNLATGWVNLPAQTKTASAQSALALTIPDNNATGITRSFDLSASNLRTEQVTVTVNIAHASRGQLAITLTSPSGTQSRLTEKHTDTGDNYSNWTFSSVRNWGENSQGLWTLRVADLTSGTTGTLSAATLTVYGTSTTPVNQPPAISAATLTPAGSVYSDQSLAITGISASDPEGDAIAFSYEWQESSDNVTFSPIASATSGTLVLANSQSGKLVRCAIAPIAAGSTGAAFLTGSAAVNHRPPTLARHGQPLSYDSDLFVTGQSANFSRPVILNEFSQGNTGNREWVEILVLKVADLRGYVLADRLGTYATFSQNAMWSAVPAGTLIVIYNAGDRDTVLPADSLTGSSIIAGHTNATAFGSGGVWGGLSNSNKESIILKNPAGTIIDALSLNSENVYDPKLGAVGSVKNAAFDGNNETDVESVSHWIIGSAATAATPGAGNGGLNTQFVSDLRTGALAVAPKFRFAVTSDLVPNLSLDADSGLLSGSPNVPGGGLFQITLERSTATETVSQSFQLLIAGADGNSLIPAGKTWLLGADLTLPSALTVSGTVDTAGHALVIPGKISLSPGASVANPTGSIAYLSRAGAPLPGVSSLIANPANDSADDDSDRLSNLLEFALGSDPSNGTNTGLPIISKTAAGSLELTYSFPAGAAGVTRTVEVSGNLILWQSGPGMTELISDILINGIRTVTVLDLGVGAPRYIRLKATR